MESIGGISSFMNTLLAPIRTILFGVVFGLLLSNCSEDDGGLKSRYLILNIVDNKANISLYNSATQSLTKQFCTLEGPFSHFSGANKHGDFLFATTVGAGYKLRKIDITTGTEVKAVNSWIYYKTYINFYNSKVVVSHIGDDGYCLKIYDENLILLDSITRTNIFQLKGVTVSNNRLFSVVGDGNKGYIHVMDLNTLTPVDSIELSSSLKLIPYREGKLLGIKSNGYFVFNTESLEIEGSKTTYIETYYGIALNQAENILYYLSPLAQPSVYPYILKKVDISTGESTILTDYGELINGPLLYDSKGKVIVSGGGLKIFSRDGEVIDWVEEAPANTWAIFVQ